MILSVENTKDYSRSLSFICNMETKTAFFIITFSANGIYKKVKIKDFAIAVDTYNDIKKFMEG